MARTFDVVLPKRRVEKDTEVNTAQRASGDFARHLLANFPSEPVSYLPARIYRTIFVRYCLFISPVFYRHFAKKALQNHKNMLYCP